MYDTYTIYTSVLWLVENMAVIWNWQYIYNNSKCSCKLWQHCIISQAVKLNDRTHTVSMAWWASRMEGNLLNETNPQNKTHFFPPEFVLCLQKWGFAASSQTSRATGEWPWMLLFPSTSHTHTHRHTCSEVQLQLSVIYCTFLLPGFYGCLSVVTRGARRFNSLHIEETHNKEGARGVRQ